MRVFGCVALRINIVNTSAMRQRDRQHAVIPHFHENSGDADEAIAGDLEGVRDESESYYDH